MKVSNPIMRGFYPDPSVCKANGKYYMVCSSFEYFPGVPLFESDDLVNWTQIGHCLTRKEQVQLTKINSSGGVFAPTIRYHEGRFYMVTTNDTYHKNFFIYTDDIYGEWSDPVFVDQEGIDPSLFFEDGKTYFMSNGSDPADGNGCIFQCEINPVTGEKYTESKPIWKGSGGRYLESPHLYKFGDWYYVMAAEGGTEYGHMITYARGKSPYGPFEQYAKNPVLTNRNLGGHQSTIQGIGHGDLVETYDGNMCMVCLGFRQIGPWQPFHNLGREVFLVPVTWNDDGWFTAGVNGTVKAQMEIATDKEVTQQIEGKYDVSFDDMKEDSHRWCHLREYRKEDYKFTETGVMLRGEDISLSDVDAVTFLGVRQSEFDTDLRIKVKSDAKEAGITFYLCEKHHYDLAVCNDGGKKKLILRLCIGDATQLVTEKEIAADDNFTELHIVSDHENYHFYGNVNGEEVLFGEAGTKYLSSEVASGFTGTVMAMYAVNENAADDKWAEFKELTWTQKIDSELY